MTPRPLRVVKVGGSLLEWQELPVVLAKWLARQSPAVNLLIAGGGELAEAIRRADATHVVGEEAAHWLCVDALSITAKLLSAIVNAEVVTQAGEIPAKVPSLCIFDPASFLRTLEPRLLPGPIPHTWKVTSDSIAARVAQFLDATELVLLKSCLPAAATADYVDGYFPTAAANLDQIRCVNLRSSNFEEIRWVTR